MIRRFLKFLGFVICFLSIVFGYYFIFYPGFVSDCGIKSCGFGYNDVLPPILAEDSGAHHDSYVFLLLFRGYENFLPSLFLRIYALFLILLPVSTFYVGLCLIKNN